MAKMKDKDRLLKSSREKQIVTNKGTSIIKTAGSKAKTLHDRREWHYILKVMKGKKLKPRMLYLARLSFRFERKIKCFTDKQKVKEFSTIKPAL